MRADLDIIQEWIPAGSRVLDLGCGDGELLAWLAEHKQVRGYGLEIDPHVTILYGLHKDIDDDKIIKLCKLLKAPKLKLNLLTIWIMTVFAS